jgi:hypothetical protein
MFGKNSNITLGIDMQLYPVRTTIQGSLLIDDQF